jgi:tRNA G46 methylase TrmB
MKALPRNGYALICLERRDELDDGPQSRLPGRGSVESVKTDSGTAFSPRSVHADKLAEFIDFVLADRAAFSAAGKWRDFFRRRLGPRYDGRVIVEIGCSDGALLGRVATRWPNTGFVGVDWQCKAIYYAARRMSQGSLDNVALLRGCAQDVARMFAPGEVHEFWVFHPEPNGGLFTSPFLLDLLPVLNNQEEGKQGSLLALKTDHPGYYQYARALFGLPEPPWFSAVRAGAQQTGPRLRRARLASPEALPRPEPALIRGYEVLLASDDFWNDPVAQGHAAQRLFGGETTTYEASFVARRYPIYYLGLKLRPR